MSGYIIKNSQNMYIGLCCGDYHLSKSIGTDEIFETVEDAFRVLQSLAHRDKGKCKVFELKEEEVNLTYRYEAILKYCDTQVLEFRDQFEYVSDFSWEKNIKIRAIQRLVDKYGSDIKPGLEYSLIINNSKGVSKKYRISFEMGLKCCEEIYFD